VGRRRKRGEGERAPFYWVKVQRSLSVMTLSEGGRGKGKMKFLNTPSLDRDVVRGGEKKKEGRHYRADRLVD